MLRLETVESAGLAHYSYFLGDTTAGLCAIIDPRRDVDIYLSLAHQHQLRITAIFETHIHADFVSGSRELAARTGAQVYLSAHTDGRSGYQFDHQPLTDGQLIELGELQLRVLHTPGHTPEHICFLVRGGTGASTPWGLFSGDTLFAGEVGRPDLLGQGTEKMLAGQLYESLHEKILPLGDGIIIYPAHGAGSPCGASIGDRPTSTIGYERRNNPLLRREGEEQFVNQLFASLSPAPAYYRRLKQINAAGPSLLGTLPHLPALTAEQFRDEMQRADTVVIDARPIDGAGGAYLPGALQIGLRDPFPIWVGRIVPAEKRLLLILPDEASVATVARHLIRIGHDNIGGYLREGIRSWFDAGLPFEQIPQISVHKLKSWIEEGDGLQLLDVRSNEEWEEGHIPTAHHLYVPDLLEHGDGLDPRKPVVTYCGSGYRANIAASLLKRRGFDHVSSVPGSMSAWKAAGYPLERS